MKFEKKKIKNRIEALFIVLLVITGCLTPALAAGTPIVDGGPEIRSAAAVVMDINSGTVLYSKNPEAAMQPSSLTKLMTAYVAFSELSGSAAITVSSSATSQTFPTAQNVGFAAGDVTTVGTAITGMLMASAEDCAYSLAEKAGGMDQISLMMNEYAEKLGLVNTHYVNCMGLFAEGHHSCAIDCAVVAARLMKDYPATGSILSMKETSVEIGSGTKTIKNGHRFITGTDSYSRCYAAKTGGSAYKGDGSWALCTYASGDGLNLVCIVMGTPENADTYSDTKLLFDYAFANFQSIVPESTGLNSKGMSELFSECSPFSIVPDVDIKMDGKASCIVPRNYDASLLRTEISYSQLENFSPGKNVIGSLKIYYNGREAGKTDIIYYTESVSMSEIGFARLFPSYLKLPKAGTISPADIINGKTNTIKRETQLTKIRAAFFSLFTKAKLFAYLFAVLLFAAGTALILIFFPTKKKVSTEGLYKKRLQETKLYDKE